MPMTLQAKLSRLAPERRAKVELRAAELLAEELERRRPAGEAVNEAAPGASSRR